MRCMRLEETRPGRDVCHQCCYIRADKTGTALARACEVCRTPSNANECLNESGSCTQSKVLLSNCSCAMSTNAMAPPGSRPCRSRTCRCLSWCCGCTWQLAADTGSCGTGRLQHEHRQLVVVLYNYLCVRVGLNVGKLLYTYSWKLKWPR